MKRMKAPVFSLLLALFSCSPLSYGQPPQAADTITTLAALQGAIERVLEETATPAAGVALVHGDSTVWVGAIGKTDVEKDIDANEHTMFRLGATSQMFVALAILKLQEEGHVSLKDTVRKLVPDLAFRNRWSDTHPILVEHLLEHTTGWDDLHLTDYALDGARLTLKEGLDHYPRSRTARWVPGTRMAFSNGGPSVAAYIVEQATGLAFEDYVQEQLFDPMGMEDMTYFPSHHYKTRGATLYMRGEPQAYWHLSMRPYGAINASPRDMARLLKFFIHRGRIDGLPLLSGASMQRMETATTTSGARAGLEVGYGLANYSSPHGRFVYRSHAGGVIGGQADLSYLPAYSLGYAVMINATHRGAMKRITTLVRNFQTRSLAPPATPQRAPQKAGHDLAGYYLPINPNNQIFYFLERLQDVKRLWPVDDTLYSKPLLYGEPQKYVPVGDGKYAAIASGKIALVQVADPLAGAVVHEGREVLKPISPLLAYGQLALAAAWVVAMVSAILFAPFWGVRYALGTLPGGPAIHVRGWPLLATVLFIATATLAIHGFFDPLELLAKATPVSVALAVCAVAFAITSAWSAVTAVRYRHADVPTFVYWHSALLSALHLIVTTYLLDASVLFII